MLGKSKQTTRRRSACQYTRYIDYCQKTDLEDQSLGNQKFGKAEIDCGFRTSETKWGLVNDQHVGIIYLDLRFSQTSKYLLDHAEVEMTFSAKDAPGTDPIVVRYYAPKELMGPEREKQVDRSAELNPSFNLPMVGAFSVGKAGVSSSAMRPYKWMFTGHLSPGDDALYYQRMRWRWESNPLVPQAEVRLVHLAVAVRHASVPFSIELAMSGKVRGLFHRANFGNKGKRELTVVVPQLLKEQLTLGADDLIADIEVKNRHLRPVDTAVPVPSACPPTAVVPASKSDNAAVPIVDPKSPAAVTVPGAVDAKTAEPKAPGFLVQGMLQCVELIRWLWLSIVGAILRLSDRKSKTA